MRESPSLEKDRAARQGSPEQSSPAKGQTANGDGIPLCKKDKKILRQVRRAFCNGLATIDEIVDCDVPENERTRYVEHLFLLLEGVCVIGKMPKAITGTLYRAKALEGRKS